MTQEKRIMNLENEISNLKEKQNKSKVYQIIGQAVVYSSLYIGSIGFCYWGFCQNTIY